MWLYSRIAEPNPWRWKMACAAAGPTASPCLPMLAWAWSVIPYGLFTPEACVSLNMRVLRV